MKACLKKPVKCYLFLKLHSATDPGKKMHGNKTQHIPLMWVLNHAGIRIAIMSTGDAYFTTEVIIAEINADMLVFLVCL